MEDRHVYTLHKEHNMEQIAVVCINDPDYWEAFEYFREHYPDEVYSIVMYQGREGEYKAKLKEKEEKSCQGISFMEFVQSVLQSLWMSKKAKTL